MLVVLLLCGVLVERNFFSKVNKASTSIYEDRLVPSVAIFHLYDHIVQRYLILNEYLRLREESSTVVKEKLLIHEKKMDSVLLAFGNTYLVANERKGLDQLRKHLQMYNRLENEMLESNEIIEIKHLNTHLDRIRTNFSGLSKIQANVGQSLLDEAHNVTSNAGMISQLQIVILIIICLITQGLILASKVIRSPIKQHHNLN